MHVQLLRTAKEQTKHLSPKKKNEDINFIYENKKQYIGSSQINSTPTQKHSPPPHTHTYMHMHTIILKL